MLTRGPLPAREVCRRPALLPGGLLKGLRAGSDDGEVTSILSDRWDCRPLLADAEDLTIVFQPIVDLASATVAGYEALSRFPGTATPDVWFAAAAEAGLGAELEGLAVAKALAAVPDLPPDTFLTVNVSPHLLDTPPVDAAFATRPDLHRVVVELTEHAPMHDLVALRRH